MNGSISKTKEWKVAGQMMKVSRAKKERKKEKSV
jgi:hypothetical protein